jgi:transcriptional regulator with GAF, ATPase, and Fis domain
MATLVALRDGRLYDIFPLAGGGLTLGMAAGGRLGAVPPGDARGLLRLTPQGEAVQAVSLPGSPPLSLNDRPCEGGKLFPGDRLRLGKVDLELHASGEEPGLAGEEQRKLFDLVAAASSQEDPDDLLAELLDRAIQHFEAERGFVLFRSRPQADLEPVASRHIDADEIGSSFSRTAVEKSRSEDRPVLIGDTSAELAESESTQLEGIRSVLCAPLGGDGALYLDSRAGTRIFTEADLQLFSTYAGYARLALRIWRDADRLRRRAARAEAQASPEPRDEGGMVVGPSPATGELVDQLDAVAGEDVTVLILGETGTGKEVLAREIHRRSRRSGGPFVAVNCMAFGGEVVASELFGHEKGAFTGATERRLGRFELADGGTLFLDEVGELSLELQVKLLRVLQERSIERMGGARPIAVDIRVVAATNKDLGEAIQAGTFREDLFYRLNVFTLHPPPLRDRRADIVVLADAFVGAAAKRMGKEVPAITDEAVEALRAHDWPGNVRELSNVCERALVLARGGDIDAKSLGLGPPGAGPGAAPAGSAGSFFEGLPKELNAAKEIFEGEFLRRALERADGNISAASKELGVPRSTIYRKCELLGIEVKKK